MSSISKLSRLEPTWLGPAYFFVFGNFFMAR